MKSLYRLYLTIFVTLALLFVGVSYAGEACIYGSAKNSDGSKIDGTCRVSTSWNSQKAYPRNGEYRLCLGSNPKQMITIYVDGKKYTALYIDGNTQLDIVRR